jgi:hypothetical protein
VFQLGDMSTSGLLFQLASTKEIQLSSKYNSIVFGLTRLEFEPEVSMLTITLLSQLEHLAL